MKNKKIKVSANHITNHKTNSKDSASKKINNKSQLDKFIDRVFEEDNKLLEKLAQ